jgi:hypothetical protein
MRENISRKEYRTLLKTFIFIGLFWTAIIVALLIWAVKDEKDKTTEIVRMQARSFFEHIVTTRFWNASHGGVYVPVTEKTRPNMYLKVPHRDIITKDGQSLTLINPAFMTRQIAEIAAEKNSVTFHITSLNPIRPGNAPEAWEAAAMKSFSAHNGNGEHYEWWLPEDKEKRVFRYIAPLWTENVCLSCHGAQGYLRGDLRGGISVTIPAKTVQSNYENQVFTSSLRYFLIWIVGMFGVILSFRLIRKEDRERSRLIDELEGALAEIKTLKGFIPICASCKKVRNDDGYWEQIEKYIRDRSDAEFSHGICPECVKKLYPEYYDKIDKKDSAP